MTKRTVSERELNNDDAIDARLGHTFGKQSKMKERRRKKKKGKKERNMQETEAEVVAMMRDEKKKKAEVEKERVKTEEKKEKKKSKKKKKAEVEKNKEKEKKRVRKSDAMQIDDESEYDARDDGNDDDCVLVEEEEEGERQSIGRGNTALDTAAAVTSTTTTATASTTAANGSSSSSEDHIPEDAWYEGQIHPLEQEDRDMIESLHTQHEYASVIQHLRHTKNAYNFNRTIAEFGQKKKLLVSLFAFYHLIDRCAAAAAAAAANGQPARKKTKKERKSELRLSVLTFTNTINACVRCGEMERALYLMDRMKEFNLSPNEVTFTVIIKGLCQDGRIDDALRMVTENMKQLRVKPNLRTFNTLLRGCMRAGDASVARKVFRELMSHHRVQPDLSAVEYYVKTLCTCLLIAEARKTIEEAMSKSLTDAAALCSLGQACVLVGDMDGAQWALTETNKALFSTQTTEKRYLEFGVDQKERRSLELFAKLRREDILRDYNMVKAYMERVERGEVPRRGNADTDGILHSDRVLFFPPRSKSLNDDAVPRFDRNLIFGSRDDDSKSGQTGTKRRPIRLEVCSGNGDWIVERAKSEPTADWVGLEIRYERVFNIWSRMIFNNLDNLAILGGEAFSILTNHIPPHTFDEVFVNYPDPPVWEGSKQRLLNEDFLHAVHRVLRNRCSLTIVTDDFSYCEMVAREFGRLRHMYRSAFGDSKPFVDRLPPNYTYSYFDRMWSIGNRNKRYWLMYKKVAPKGRANVE